MQTSTFETVSHRSSSSHLSKGNWLQGLSAVMNCTCNCKHLQLKTVQKSSPKTCPKTNWKQFRSLPLTSLLFTGVDGALARSKNTLFLWSSEFHSEPRGESKIHTYSLENFLYRASPFTGMGSKTPNTQTIQKSHLQLWILNCVRNETIWQHTVSPAADHYISKSVSLMSRRGWSLHRPNSTRRDSTDL